MSVGSGAAPSEHASHIHALQCGPGLPLAWNNKTGQKWCSDSPGPEPSAGLHFFHLCTLWSSQPSRKRSGYHAGGHMEIMEIKSKEEATWGGASPKLHGEQEANTPQHPQWAQPQPTPSHMRPHEEPLTRPVKEWPGQTQSTVQDQAQIKINLSHWVLGVLLYSSR